MNKRYSIKLTLRKEGKIIDIWLLEAGAMLAGAAAWGVFTHKIPNKWLLFWMVLVIFDGPERFAAFLAVAAAAACGTFLLFYFRMIGAGDCKLMALTCGYLGIRGGFLTIAIGFVIGAAWSLGKLLFGGQGLQRTVYLLVWIRQTIRTKQRIPYFNIEEDGYGATVPLAVCLMGGFLATVCLGGLQ